APRAGEVLAEVALTGAAAGELGQALVAAPQRRLEQGAVALGDATRARRELLDDAGDLVAEDGADVGVVGGEQRAEAGDVEELEVGAADPRGGRTQPDPSRPGQARRGELLHAQHTAATPRRVVAHPQRRRGP